MPVGYLRGRIEANRRSPIFGVLPVRPDEHLRRVVTELLKASESDPVLVFLRHRDDDDAEDISHRPVVYRDGVPYPISSVGSHFRIISRL